MEDINILLIGDPHLVSESPVASTLVISETLKIAKDKKPDIIVLLGDVMHFHAKADITPLKWATDWFQKLQNIAPTYVLIGNHDMKNPDQFLQDDHIFFANKFIESGPIIVDKVIEISKHGHKFILMPFVPAGRMMEALNTINITHENITSQNISAIFCHQDVYANIRGIDWDGDIWPEEYPQVYSGHIHHYIVVQPNWTYVGSSRQVSCAEDPPKTISSVLFGEGGPVESRIKLNVPIKQKISVDIANFKKGKYPLPIENKMVSYFLYVTGETHEIETLKKSKLFKAWKMERKDVKIIFPIIKNKNSPHISQNKLNDSKSYLDVLLESVKGTDMEDDLKNVLAKYR